MRKIAFLALCLTFLAAGAPAQARPSCGATFYKYNDLKGISVTRHGPEEVYDTDDVHYPNGEDLDGDVYSVGTLADTWLELYGKEGFRKLRFTLPPNTWRNVYDVDSYRIICRPPHGGPDYGPGDLK